MFHRDVLHCTSWSGVKYVKFTAASASAARSASARSFGKGTWTIAG